MISSFKLIIHQSYLDRARFAKYLTVPIRRRKFSKANKKVEAQPQLPNEIVAEILRFTFYEKGYRNQPMAFRCTEVCRQWKKVIERDLAQEWFNQIRTFVTKENDKEQQEAEELIQMWQNVLKLAPKQMSQLLLRRIVQDIRPLRRMHPRVKAEPASFKDLFEFPSMSLQRLPYWQPWHSGTSDPFEPIKYFKTCIFEPEWFTFLYTNQKRNFLSDMDSMTVSRGSKIYGWTSLLLHLPFLESWMTLWILAFRRENFFANLMVPQDGLISWQMTIYYFINFFAFANTEIAIGVWATIPARVLAAICFGILTYGLEHIFNSMVLMILAYVVGGFYYCITNKRDRPIAEILACFAFILVYPPLGIMLLICLAGFPWEGEPRKYLLSGFALQLLSYLFYDYSTNFFRFIL